MFDDEIVLLHSLIVILLVQIMQLDSGWWGRGGFGLLGEDSCAILMDYNLCLWLFYCVGLWGRKNVSPHTIVWHTWSDSLLRMAFILF